MHIPENVQITIPVASTTTNSFGRADAERGVVLVAAQTANDSEKTTASKSSAANQDILGTVGGEGDMAKVTGEIVMQTTAAFTAAQMSAGFIQTTTTAGKVEPGDAAGFAAGNDRHGIITRQGNDATIGDWIAIIL